MQVLLNSKDQHCGSMLLDMDIEHFRHEMGEHCQQNNSLILLDICQQEEREQKLLVLEH